MFSRAGRNKMVIFAAVNLRLQTVNAKNEFFEEHLFRLSMGDFVVF